MSLATTCDISESTPHDLIANVAAGSAPVELAVVVPTYNERENVPLLIARLEKSLGGLNWEAIFVDDDSPDGTGEVVSAHASAPTELAPRIRLIQRVGRRGLSSACIEGMLATVAPLIAVMDADLQHDETALPTMLRCMRAEALDLVVGTRNAAGGSMGPFCPKRVLLSRIGQKISHAICRCELSDPMSGFFLARRSFFLEVVHELQGGGFKILVDMLSSAQRPVRIGEVGYTFAARRHGESKLDMVVGIEYLFLILNRKLGATIPVEWALYLLVGSLGLLTHLLILFVLTHLCAVPFVPAQVSATFVSMIENFYLNNRITFRDRRFRGMRTFVGGTRFVVACSFGAWANVVFAHALLNSGVKWYLAGFAGILLGSVWNLSISSLFTWRPMRAAPATRRTQAIFAADFEVNR